ncbi:tubulin glycylase 3A-like [Neodiprion virginianus]|uniref:tubulin glycylase 3A-like n=1 Tax=Neodiprion virginianus TaxID=2961670 RepID=UPI001EE71200|nr:tubulin glycylase 3A-like [Neodiprion virginianus]
MERKTYPEDVTRSNLNLEQESTMINQPKKLNLKEFYLTPPMPVTKRPISISKQDSTKQETRDLKPNVALGSSRYLETNSGFNTKQPRPLQKYARTVKETKQRGQSKVGPSTHTSNVFAYGSGIEGLVKAAKVPKRTPKSAAANRSDSTNINKPLKQPFQLTMSRNNPGTTIDDTMKILNPHDYPGKSKTANTFSPATRYEQNVGSQCDKIVCNAACLIELSRKECYNEIQQMVAKAIKNHKIFLIRGDIPYLEASMKSRGWVQKYESTKTRMVPYGSVASLDAPSLGSIQLPDGSFNEKMVIFQMLRHVPPDFIWDCRNEFTDWNSNIKQSTLLNRFQKSFIYTSKLGMATILEDTHWNYEEKVSNVQYPRTYNACRDKNAFVEDYRMTAAVSLLKWFVEQIREGVEYILRGSSPISIQQIEFAIKRCEQLVATANNEYLDVPQAAVSSQEWDSFIQNYIKAVHLENGFVETTSGPPFPEIEVNTAIAVLKKVKDIDPQFELNGYRNIWILKPSDLCCGTGIVMTHKLSHIMKRVYDGGRDYFVVQKYIEKPFLVECTKFDVRQWYLVTKSYPLTIWIYKESFLRFSSRPFSFANYHEAVHICNTAVQCKYSEQKNSVRAKDWDCKKINEYLKKAGYSGEPWYDEVYPKIREAIIATMLAAQKHMDKRRCSFELYGADFMIMNDLSVWLIEINTNPRMHPPSTRVTERLYPDVMESLVKVVLDRPVNPNADTGNFVLAYQQNVTDFQPYLGASMFVLGEGINRLKPKSLQERENSVNP